MTREDVLPCFFPHKINTRSIIHLSSALQENWSGLRLAYTYSIELYAIHNDTNCS